MSAGELTVLAPGVGVWLGEGRFGHPNAGVVVDPDGLTLVDTLMVGSQFIPFARAVGALERPIRRVVLTSSHIPFVGGTAQFWAAAFFGRELTSELLDLPPNVHGYRRLVPELAAEFDEDLRTRPITHTVSADAALTDAVRLHLCHGESAENLVVEIPGAPVLFAGAMASFGVTPLAFDGDPAAWAVALRGLASRWQGPVVPGHGPVGGAGDLVMQAEYLEACVAGRVPPGPWDRWSDRRFDEVNLQRAALLARGEDRPPPAMLALLGLA